MADLRDNASLKVLLSIAEIELPLINSRKLAEFFCFSGGLSVFFSKGLIGYFVTVVPDGFIVEVAPDPTLKSVPGCVYWL